MPDPIRLLSTLRQAIWAFRSTPGRRGRLICLENSTEVLVAGDMHGNLENFRRLLHKANLGQNPKRHLVLQEAIHGPYTYPDGGDKSHQLLDLIAALKCQYPGQVHFLIGNHELSQSIGRAISKGDANLNRDFIQGVETAYGPHAAEVLKVYNDLIAAAPLAIRTPNRVFISHSLPAANHLEEFHLEVLERDTQTPGDFEPGGTVHVLLWGRDTRQETVEAYLAKVDADLLISGHIPCENGFEVPNSRQIILDSLGHPAAYCLFPTDRPIGHDELVRMVKIF